MRPLSRESEMTTLRYLNSSVVLCAHIGLICAGLLQQPGRLPHDPRPAPPFDSGLLCTQAALHIVIWPGRNSALPRPSADRPECRRKSLGTPLKPDSCSVQQGEIQNRSATANRQKPCCTPRLIHGCLERALRQYFVMQVYNMLQFCHRVQAVFERFANLLADLAVHRQWI